MSDQEATEQPLEELATHLRLHPDDLVPAELIERRWYAWVPMGTPIERVMDPRYLTRCGEKLRGSHTIERPVDIITFMPTDRRWWLETFLLSIGSEEILVLKMRHGEFPDVRKAAPKQGPLGTNLEDFEIRPLGPHKGHAVVRKHDGHVAYEGRREDQCKVWLTRYLSTVRK